ncbi:hypothetical protein FT643_16990 [Ketobacter sp. MCCC 1A13808]|uniref:hypothetical protein n=1 Tax=Ketobacter sp. MCCC 1A13808 TaxID=2602738 RepID=UPI000F2819A7|nr:hypothetical protein [Ketobacter sp. MCCC 1A13808]MVF13840.1 hypothetical protein [Ketobacter sp. MCCC 1A13808]RLP54891.1 MAG: hypothetical protein D6160_08760 [Ketobacter sp.]
MSAYDAPRSNVDRVEDAINNSGMKQDEIPEGVKGWSWGAFFLNWIWGIFNKSYISLLALIPYVGFVVAIYLGIKGRELAWKNKQWDSIEHFNSVQRKWSVWAVCLMVIPAVLGILAAIIIPAMQSQ